MVRVKEPEAGEQRIDYAGITTLSIGLVSLLVALDQVDDWGWGDPRVIGMFVLAALLVPAFVPIERRAGAAALIPRAVIRNESFRASCVAVLLMSATFFAALLYLPQFMQKQLGYSPLEAGVGMLPFLATFALVSFIAGPLYNRVGAKVLATLGAACITIAPFAFSQVSEGSGYGSLVAGLVILGIGIGSFYPTATTAGVTSVDASQSSLAGGILYVPDRRWLDRAWADDHRLLLPGLVRRQHPGRLPPGRTAVAGRLRDHDLLRWRPAASPHRRRGRYGLALCGGLPWLTSLVPGPPASTSLPGPPRNMSSPGPPTSTS